MSVTIELSPEIEAGLLAQASARGLAVPDYVKSLIVEQMPVPAQPHFSLAERAAALRDIRHLPLTPPLSDEAISRESMYGPRG